MDTITYILPVYWASYLINADDSGLSEDELDVINEWLIQENNPDFVDVSEDSWFSWHNDVNLVGGDVAEYTAIIREEK